MPYPSQGNVFDVLDNLEIVIKFVEPLDGHRITKKVAPVYRETTVNVAGQRIQSEFDTGGRKGPESGHPDTETA
jgi:hypothetical protein